MKDFALIGVWSRMDDGDEVRYTFRGDGTMTISALGVGTDLKYSVENQTLFVENLEEGTGERALSYRIRNDTLTVCPVGSSVMTTLKRCCQS